MAPTERTVTDVCVIGGGPAGSTIAARLAQLGHDVCLIERASFPRRQLGESLTPGVLPLLESTGARQQVEVAGFTRVRSVQMQWEGEGELTERVDPRQQGVLVDRGRFDLLLLEHARALGVRVLQPAAVRERRHDDDGWTLRVEREGRSFDLRARFLADASGRSGALPGDRRATGCRTIALYAYWHGSRTPDQPRLEAGRNAWFWGVPLPDGSYNTLVFVDGARFLRAPAGSLDAIFHELIGASGLLADCRQVRLLGPVRAAEATPYLDLNSVTPISIKVGDAAVAIDPLSSSGVQKALQTSLAGAVVVNSLLRKPTLRDTALRFYQENLASASERHRRWAAEHYGAVAARKREVGDGNVTFWEDRSVGPSLDQQATPSLTGERATPNTLVALSPLIEFVDVPCIEGEFVAVKSALRHPGLESPLAYLGGWELAPLLRMVRAGMTPVELARAWNARMPLQSALAVAGWLYGRGILVPHGSGPGTVAPAG